MQVVPRRRSCYTKTSVFIRQTKAASTRRNFHATDSRASQVACISELHELSTRCILLRIVGLCITLSFIHFRPIICELRAIDASKLNMMNLSKRCVPLGAIRLHLKMHAKVARKLHGNCIVWTQPYILAGVAEVAGK